MKRIKWLFVVVLTFVSVLYWLSLNDIERTFAPWALRKSVLYYTGVMSFAAMTFSVILALRLRIVERYVGGLDTHYRLHKWLGIAAAGFALLHWFSKKYKWLVEMGWYQNEDFVTPKEAVNFFQHDNIFKPFEAFAKNSSEWALYGLLLLAVLALWKKFPYRAFFKTHRILAFIYLVLAFHSLVLFGKINWATPIGFLVGGLISLGIPAAFVSLIKKIGVSHRASGLIDRIHLHETGLITEVDIALTSPWEGHKEGQFAFVTFDKHEGHHPYTLSSRWKNDGMLTFYIKQLGDYTRTLGHSLHIGDAVTVEGPYGKFDLAAHKGPQVWIAGGIGITPFLARLEALSETNAKNVSTTTLFFSARTSDQLLIERVQQLCQQANVVCHLFLSGKSAALSATKICEIVPNIKQHTVWFCGSTGFGQAIKKSLLKSGLPSRQFHQELFNMR